MNNINGTLFSTIHRTAEISPCGQYRYTLGRQWDAERSNLGWIMLNPSTADATKDDATIRRCMSFARAWGYGGIEVRNLFALRATYPAELLQHDDPIGGERGTQAIFELNAICPTIVAAWGALDKSFHVRARIIHSQLTEEYGVALRCVGLTKDFWPRHPLYVAAKTALIPCERCGK